MQKRVPSHGSIRRVKVHGLTGVMIKLAAICPGPDNVDLGENIFASLRAIERLTGERFTRQAAMVLNEEV